MKFAAVKIGGNIYSSHKSTTGGAKEARSIVEMLKDDGNQVDTYMVKKTLKGENVPDIYDTEGDHEKIINGDYDALLVFNGNVTYFGGADHPEWTILYKIMTRFPGKVFYINTDLNLLLTQIYGSVQNKPWAGNYNIDDIKITRDDIVYICQAQKPEVVINDLNKKAATVHIKEYDHFDFQKFVLYDRDRLYNNISYNENPKFDLGYGGSIRTGSREADMLKYYFGIPEDISVEMFGHISKDSFNQKKIAGLRAPEFGKSCDSSEFISRMNEDLMSTVVIADPSYKRSEHFTPRIYESILANIVTFIDISYDPSKKIYTNEELKEFNYVNSKSELVEKIRKLKEDPEYRKHIVELQLSDINFDRDAYRHELTEVIKRHLN